MEKRLVLVYIHERDDGQGTTTKIYSPFEIDDTYNGMIEVTPCEIYIPQPDYDFQTECIKCGLEKIANGGRGWNGVGRGGGLGGVVNHTNTSRFYTFLEIDENGSYGYTDSMKKFVAFDTKHQDNIKSQLYKYLYERFMLSGFTAVLPTDSNGISANESAK